MAVYTNVADDELAHFLKRYGLGKLLSFKGIAEGVENTNYVIYTETGTHILTLYEKRVRTEDLPFFLNLMEFLAQNGITCPTPIRDVDGNMLQTLAGRPAAVVTFLNGMWIRRPQVEHCTALGATLANLHLVGQKCSLHRNNTLSLSDWRSLYDAFKDEADSIKPGLRTLIEEELHFLENNWPTHLPKGIIHADLFPDNVFFIDQNISGVIDFYFSCYDTLSYDLAICLNAWCFEPDISFNVTKASALLKAYDKVRQIEPAELYSLPIMARGAALRFLLTRVYDWLNTSETAFVARKDPEEYIRKLRFHQTVDDIKAYGFDT
ncbi:MAG: homoserine kinase [Pseudomonadota bacterium]